MSKVLSLFSGSTGNAFYVNSGDTSILIDAGVSAKMLTDKMLEFDISPSKINAVFLTHEHTDHTKGVRVFCDKYKIPLFASEGTLKGVELSGFLPKTAPIYKINKDGDAIGNLLVTGFETPHDCNESNGYTIETEDGKKITVCTDLGYVTDTVKNAIFGSDFILLESNHDINMLKNGSYPAVLKRRILGMFGHLSNDACDECLVELIENGTKEVMLGHISRENNSVPLVLSSAVKTLLANDMKENEDYLISAAGIEGNGRFRVL